MATNIRTSSADINYLSISNGITNLNPEATLDQSKAIIGGPVPDLLIPDNWSLYASLLKLGDNTTNLTLSFRVIDQGKENVVDINNHVSNVGVHCPIFGLSGQSGNQTFSIKGGCSTISLSGSIGSSNTVDVLIGNWSDQSQNVDAGITLLLSRVDKQPVTIVIGRGLVGYLLGNKNNLALNGAKFLFWRSVLEWGYWWGKWAAVKTIYKWFPSLDK